MNHPLFVLLLLLLTSNCLGPVSPYAITATFSETDNGGLLQHLVVDKTNGQVYVGAINRLYQLSADLEQQLKMETGPRHDSLQCPADGCPHGIPTQLTDNINKALVIDSSNNRLIFCGTLHQGTCSVRNLGNVGEELMEMREAVVANNATASTVVFIAPGPPNTASNDVLYVGVTYTDNSPFRKHVPAVSSRSLSKGEMFQIVQKDVTRLYLNPEFISRYPIHYVAGFSAAGFSFFLTTQKRDTTDDSPYISKLARVCQSDPDNYSYAEVPIECEDKGGVKYSLVQAAYVDKPGDDLAELLGASVQREVLYAVFAQPENRGSALCVFTFQNIRNTFGHVVQSRVRSCVDGNAKRGLDYFSSRFSCSRLIPPKNEDDDYCALGDNSPLVGSNPITKNQIIYKTSNELLTSLAVKRVGDSIVAFLGTSEGHLKKVSFGEMRKSQVQSFEYDIIIDQGNRVLSDMPFDQQQMHLYVLTQRKVTKIAVQQCKAYATCGECLGAKDPSCGWCSLENKCSLMSECGDDDNYPIRWMSYNTEDDEGDDPSVRKWKECITFTSVKPNRMERNRPGIRTLTLLIDNLPSIARRFSCAFSVLGRTLVTNAIRMANGLHCAAPSSDEIPAIPPGQHDFNATLSVRITASRDIVATNFTFYDCATYTSCTDCISSSYRCDWCSLLRQCTDDSSTNCRNDIIVQRDSSVISCPGTSFMPEPTVESTEIMMVHYGVKKGFKVKLVNIDPSMATSDFVCQFDIQGRVTKTGAKLMDDLIHCDDMEFTYSSPLPSITASLTILWGESKSIEKTQQIIVYRCGEMAENCGRCLALPSQFLCRWCQTSDKCEFKGNCTGGWLMDQNEICQNPEVKHFSPRLGPWEGGTNVTIDGINLGKTFTDISGGISVAGLPCHPYEELYVKTQRIVCRVDGLKRRESRSGPIIFRVSNFQSESMGNYEFVDPIIESIDPISGPLSGGTKLTIRGRHLNAGSSIKVTIDPASLPCAIISNNATHVICQTSASHIPQSGHLLMAFDWAVRRFTDQKYQYVQDPIMNYAELDVISQVKTPKGITSGGITIFVFGNNFKDIQSDMFVRYRDVVYSGICQVLSHQQLQCMSPSVPVADDYQIPADEPLSLDYGFVLNDVVQDTQNFSKFLLYPDPTCSSFNQQVMFFKADYLVINGSNLDLACQEEDVKVKIGPDACNVTSLSRNQLTCRPPTNRSTGLHQVTVQFGQNLRYVIGKLSYQSPEEEKLPTLVVIGEALGGGVLAVIIIGVASGLSLISAIIVIAYRGLSNFVLNSRNRQHPEGQSSRPSRNNTTQRSGTVSSTEETEREQVTPRENVADIRLPREEQRWEFPINRIKFGKQIGYGCFGRVFKGKAFGLKSNGTRTVKTVAIKTVRSKRNAEDLEALERELKILMHLGWHLNVLNLLGAVTKGRLNGELLLIVEYCRFGNLRSCLVENRCNFINQLDQLGNYHPNNDTETIYDLSRRNAVDCEIVKGNQRRQNQGREAEDTQEPPTIWGYQADPDIEVNRPIYTRDLMSWSLQIAKGMGYLASKKVYHGDLAARNILLADNGVVKVADFGMSCKIYCDKDCKELRSGRIPVRWMAIESLTHNISSIQSDVWSYGIVLWELFTLGKNPYPGITDKELADEIEKGYRLKKPNFAPNFMEEVMNNCWKIEAKDRPTFTDLEKIIKVQMEESVCFYYCNLNSPYEKFNEEKENVPTENLGLTKLLNVSSKLKKSHSLPVKVGCKKKISNHFLCEGAEG